MAAWGTRFHDAAPMLPKDLYLVRVGQHECFDRVVFDVNGVLDGPEAVGFSVAYVDGEVTADASGLRVPTDGSAALEVRICAPALGYGASGHQPGRLLARLGDDLVDDSKLSRWASLRDVSFAGSFEGQTKIALGVSAELSFRVSTIEEGGRYTWVVVDIAHPR